MIFDNKIHYTITTIYAIIIWIYLLYELGQFVPERYGVLGIIQKTVAIYGVYFLIEGLINKYKQLDVERNERM